MNYVFERNVESRLIAWPAKRLSFPSFVPASVVSPLRLNIKMK